MAENIGVEILESLAPGSFHYGMTCIVEFEPHSVWHEVSLTLAAQALDQGVKTEYHVFQHTPAEIRRALEQVGVDVEKFEREGLLRVMDSYTPTTPLAGPPSGRMEPLLSGSRPDAEQWAKAIREKMRTGFGQDEKRWLHIDDNEAVLLGYSSAESVLTGWRTTFVPMAKSREMLILHSVSIGMASEAFRQATEAMADAVIDVVRREQDGRLENYIRLRALRGVRFDSSWRRIEVMSTGQVVIEGPRLEEQRRLAAIMFTDMVGYTAMAQRNEAQADELLEEHRGLLRPIFNKHGGKEINTIGDAFLIEFTSALDAIRCALEAQTFLKGLNEGRPDERKIMLRIGIHLGDVIHRGKDVSGDAVNVASRIEPLADPGGICLTAQVYYSVLNKVECTFESMGNPPLKNVSTPVEVFRVSGVGSHLRL